jgi:hypothetical protein
MLIGVPQEKILLMDVSVPQEKIEEVGLFKRVSYNLPFPLIANQYGYQKLLAKN